MSSFFSMLSYALGLQAAAGATIALFLANLPIKDTKEIIPDIWEHAVGKYVRILPRLSRWIFTPLRSFTSFSLSIIIYCILLQLILLICIISETCFEQYAAILSILFIPPLLSLLTLIAAGWWAWRIATEYWVVSSVGD